MSKEQPKSVSVSRQNQLESDIAKLLREFESETGFSVVGDIRVLRNGTNKYEPVWRTVTFLTSIDKEESKLYVARSN